MAWDPEFEEMMHQTVDIKPFVDFDDYGEASHGDPNTVKCYIDSQPRQVINQTGQEVTSNTTIFLAGPVSVSINDLVILPSEAPRERSIVSVSLMYDDEGPHHTEVHL
jgi:hypothetical protein